jgi:hypothetical protein
VAHAAGDPPAERRGRVLAEVEAVAAVDGLEQEIELDPLDAVAPVLLGRAAFHRARRRHGYRVELRSYSQTRISESS